MLYSQSYLKSFGKILFSLTLLFAMQTGIASVTTGTEGTSTLPTEAKDQQQTGQQLEGQQKLDEEPIINEEPEVQVEQDSVEDDSVNKYNFIFYFLYKFKYDHQEAPI